VSPSLPAAWLSLDESDSDLVVFLSYFVAAIRTVFPESLTETLALLHAPGPADQAQLLVSLGNELERLPARAVLVLDDYYTLRGQAVHDFLSELLRHWPQRLHLVLISRSNPSWPLANLRAKGQVAEIRTRDLRFTPEESATFLNQALTAPLSPSALAALDQQLEGWIAGLRLVTLSLGAGANAESELIGLQGAPVEIADYLADEVMAGQTPAMLRFLLVTSILDRFCAPLCETILASDAGSDDPPCDAQACIQWLERNNLFVTPLDNDRQWYRYHHLFQELLQRRLLAEVGAEQVTELHRRAATWFAGQGLIEEALRHVLTIGDLDVAAQLIVVGFCDLLNREDGSTLDRWLRLLPDEFIQRHPWLLTIKAIVLGSSWQLVATWKLLGQIEALLGEGDERGLRLGDPHDLPVLRGIIATLRGQEAYNLGQADRAIACSEEALALLPRRWSYVRGIAKLYWGLGMHAAGRGDAAQRTLIDEYAGLLEKTDTYAVRLLFAACFNAIESGHLEQARLLAQAMLDHAMSSRLPHAVGFGHNFLGVVHYCWNELDAAGQHFEELVVKRFVVHTQAARNGMIGMVRVHMARAEIAAAWSVMELLSQFDLDRLGQDGDDARSLRAQLAYVQGDSESALRWADAYETPVMGRSLLWLQDPHLAKARILLARGTGADLQAALDILHVLREFAQHTCNVRVQIEVLALHALALERQGKAADAVAALLQAVELARPGGFIRVFVDLGSPMQAMLLRLAGQGFAAETVRRILAAFPEPQTKTATGATESQSRAANARLVDPLTDRELDVLALLRGRLSNQEIASQLVLSTATVKRYTVNIYQKLGVNKRRDAVVEAEALGILPPR
ncbi:MAG TPA: LuxR C-terminal-related transcriptional regulator, partial [Anaerolineae bacterium]|nr:LuxR C-terminal-related transcriptional regulator [Anaerolineae bacterium]